MTFPQPPRAPPRSALTAEALLPGSLSWRPRLGCGRASEITRGGSLHAALGLGHPCGGGVGVAPLTPAMAFLVIISAQAVPKASPGGHIEAPFLKLSIGETGRKLPAPHEDEGRAWHGENFISAVAPAFCLEGYCS